MAVGLSAAVSAQSPLPQDDIKTACFHGAPDWQRYETCLAMATHTIVTDGTYLVGLEIPEGTYKTLGAPADSPTGMCSAERLSGLGGTPEEIIAVVIQTGPTFVTASVSDKAVTFSGGCTWTWLTD